MQSAEWNSELRRRKIFTTEAHGMARKNEMNGFYLIKTGR
jgi:hypothetical protein